MPGSSFWAPEPEFLPAINRSAIYFSAFSNGTYTSKRNVRCIGRLTAAPGGPWVPDPDPVECRDDGTYSLIDPTLFRDPRNGQNYLLYQRADTRQIMIRTIAPDGKAGLGRPKAIVSVTQEWEGSNVEAPTLVWNAGQNRFYLFYSGGYYKLDSYAVGVSRSRTADPMGDWDKYPQRPRYKDSYPSRSRPGNPILSARLDRRFCGSGHQDVTYTPRDGWLIFYHAYMGSSSGSLNCPNPGSPRYLMMDKLEWNAPGGWPRVNDGTPSG